MTALDEHWWEAVSAAISTGRTPFSSPRDFDRACEHVVRLLADATLLLEAESHATATFLAITAIEEAAKAHIQVFRRSDEEAKRRDDPLFSHREKHKIAVSPTVAMGSRLQAAMGEDAMNLLIKTGRSGGFVELRESALYFAKNEADNLIVPGTAVTRLLARNLLLLAIEVFDDGLARFTNHSLDLSRTTDDYFARVAAWV